MNAVTESDFFAEVLSIPGAHYRWLESLGHMEFSGSRKIHNFIEKSDQADISVFQHAFEEARHAHYFKRLALALSPEQRAQEKIFPMARNYLHRIDVKVCKSLRDQANLPKEKLRELAYLLTTFVIEKRAEFLYPLYSEVLQKAGFQWNILSLIKEEERHLDEMQDKIEAESAITNELMESLFQFEQELWERFKQNILTELKKIPRK